MPGIMQDGLTFVYGASMAGKSWYVLDLMLAMASTAPFYGAKLCKTGRTLYVASEGGPSSIGERAECIRVARGLDPGDRWVVVPQGCHLDDVKSISDLFADHPGPWVLVVFDTLHGSMMGDENTSTDAAMVLNNLQAIRREQKCDVIVIHHEGKNTARGMRGSSSLFAAADGVIHVERDDDANLTTVTVEKLRDGALPRHPTHFTLGAAGVLDLVQDGRGTVADLREREAAIRAVLVRLSADAPQGVPGTQWKAACKSDGLISGGKATLNSQWQRAIKYLTTAGMIEQHGKRFLPTDPPTAGTEFTD